MKILVTGAAGSLGKALIKTLLEDPANSVFATDIKVNPFDKNEQLEYQQLDLRDKAFFQWVKSNQPDQIIHLASILQISARMTREQAYEVDVKATEKLLETAVEIGVEKFTITTSGAVYGYFEENKNIITEERKPRGNKDYFYSAHKAEVESIMADYRKNQPQLKQLVFRPGAILGPDFEGPVVNLFRQKMLVGLMGYPGPFNFIYSEDVIDWIIEGLHTDITGEYNMAGDGILSMAQIAKKLGKFYLALPVWLVRFVLAVAKPLGLTQYGPEQVKFIKFRPVLSNEKIKRCFKHQPRYTSDQVIDVFLASEQASDN